MENLINFHHMLHSAWIVWVSLLFVAIVFWAFRPKNKKRFDDDAMIIFKNENGGKAHG